MRTKILPLRRLPRRPLVLALAVVLAQRAAAQESSDLSFSIDFHGPTISVPGTNGPPITAGDILVPAAGEPQLGNPQLPPPAIRRTGGDLGLSTYGLCVGTPPTDFCKVEVDALSYGLDFLLPSTPGSPYRILFSVDEWAEGNGNPGGNGPSVTSEAFALDACADIFSSIAGLGPGPIGIQPPRPNLALVDGNGLVSQSNALYPGVGVKEPTSKDQGIPDAGDNIDALDVGKVPALASDPVYFSLDADFLDPLELINHTGTARSQGFEGADVLVKAGIAGIALYASGQQLGLDLGGPGTDDLDVLILHENGIAGYQVSNQPYDWESATNPSDMLLFSVRRGSAVIGKPDSLQGLAIEEGDLLVPPVSGSSGNPGILIAAEALGLSTSRSGSNSDDMNAGDSRSPSPFRDCQPNGTEDARDIGSGTSVDLNMNGIPDECESPCEPPSIPCKITCACSSGSPCNNDDSGAGCVNSTGVGALLWGTGSSSWGVDDLVLTTTNMPVNKFGLSFMSRDFVNPMALGDGLRCVGGAIKRLGVQGTGTTGSFSIGPGLVSYTQSTGTPTDDIAIGETWHFQTWFRENPGSSACGGGSNLANAWSLTFTL